MRISFSGPAKCSLIFESIKYCPCPTCDSWAALETQPFKDDPQRTYGIIELERYDQVISFEVCWDHEMLMNLIAYPDRQTARTLDQEMFVCGWKRNDRWTDNFVTENNLCVVTIEVLCVTATLAFAPLPSPPSIDTPPSSPYPMVTYRRRCPQLFTNHLHRDGDKNSSASTIKVELDDHHHRRQSETIKVEVDDFYQPRAMLSTMPMAMPIPKLVPVSEKQEIDCSQGQYTPPPAPAFPPWPLLSQGDSYCHQYTYTPPPPTVKKVEKEINWEQYSFPPPPPPCRPAHEEVTASTFSKTPKHGHAIWRRFNARIRSRS
ncbi:hypothetical protein BGZ96_011625 [Linnemannia gamsii]|uniref:Uncharacterized protein n=1 Tax=Linnemannia gamsii TaxID=64522 RepID=A0ABQ7JRY4_9FUNG|nr:hypothetical protein BGZ96_011625 [Linnemannia gamsii]